MNDHRLYRTIWRWHFYAGLIVAPFLLILSVTGAIYLFGDDLNDLTMPELQFVPPVARPLPPSRLIAAAVRAYPGSATRIDLPGAADRTAKVYVTPHAGAPRQVMVDPASARVLGSFVYTRTLVGFADVMHGSLTLGYWGDIVVELAACWALVLIVTGVFLWWPRGRRSLAGVLWPRLAARGRRFWRDLHAVTGAWTVVLIAFLLLTGLPWAAIEGPLLRAALAGLGIGNAAGAQGYNPPQSRPLGEALGRVPWSQETQAMPASDPLHAGHDGAGATSADAGAIAGVDAIAMQAAPRGIAGAYRLYLPAGPRGIYTVITYPGRPQGQRTLHFDRWSHRLIGADGWARYGVGAKAVELGVQLHMGRYFGRANQLLMLLPCLAIPQLVVSGIAMWWRRRPQGRLGAPPAVADAPLRAVVVVVCAAGVLLPLFGSSLILLAVFDRALATARHHAPA